MPRPRLRPAVAASISHAEPYLPQGRVTTIGAVQACHAAMERSRAGGVGSFHTRIASRKQGRPADRLRADEFARSCRGETGIRSSIPRRRQPTRFQPLPPSPERTPCRTLLLAGGRTAIPPNLKTAEPAARPQCEGDNQLPGATSGVNFALGLLEWSINLPGPGLPSIWRISWKHR